MKRHILTLAVLAMAFAACQNTNSNNAQTASETTEAAMMQDEKPAMEAPAWAGTYVGTLPAADTGGYVTVLELRADNTYRLQEEAADKKFKDEQEGTFVFEGGKFTLTSEKGEKTYYALKDNGKILLLDKDGNEIKTELDYSLTKKM
ncbi:copper resistance protein NlpE [Capnocytophaga haemolytica]